MTCLCLLLCPLDVIRTFKFILCTVRLFTQELKQGGQTGTVHRYNRAGHDEVHFEAGSVLANPAGQRI